MILRNPSVLLFPWFFWQSGILTDYTIFVLCELCTKYFPGHKLYGYQVYRLCRLYFQVFFLKRGSRPTKNGSQAQVLGSLIFSPDRISLLATSRGAAPIIKDFLVHTGSMNGSNSFRRTNKGHLNGVCEQCLLVS